MSVSLAEVNSTPVFAASNAIPMQDDPRPTAPHRPAALVAIAPDARRLMRDAA